MPAYKTLLVGSEWKLAGRKRKCYHSSSHTILKGDLVLEVAVGSGVQGYCANCAEQMIEQAFSRLDLLKSRKPPL